MKRPRDWFTRRVIWPLQAAPVYLAFGLLGLLPVRLSSALCGWGARLLGPLLPVTIKARVNLNRAFPDKSRREISRIVRGVWENLGRTAGEYPHLRRMWDDSLRDQVDARGGIAAELEKAGAGEHITYRTARLEVVGIENFLRLLVDEGPAIIFSAHMGNWELLPLGAANFGAFISVVYRTPNNPYVARLIERMRGDMSELLPKGLQGAAATTRVLDQGGRLGFLIDQKQNGGIPVPFFGRPAMTGVTLARMVLKFGCPVYGAWVQRLGGNRFRITVTPPLEFPTTGDEKADVAAIMTEVNRVVEGWVRERPDQWLWLHNRWPKGTPS